MSTSHYKQLSFFTSTSVVFDLQLFEAQSQILSPFKNVNLSLVRGTKEKKEIKPIIQKCKLKQLTLFRNCLLWRSDMQTLRL